MRGIRVSVNRVVVIMVLCLCGCSGHRATDARGYVRYVFDPDKGLIQNKTIGPIKYEAVYLTPEAMTLLDLKDSVSESKYNSLLPEYKGMQYVKLTIKGDKKQHVYNAIKGENGDPDQIEAYLNLDAQNDFTMIRGRDTLSCGLYSFSKTYGLGEDWQIIMGFERKDTISDVYLKYNDRITNSGILLFVFSKNDLKKLPEIKL